MEGAFMSDIDLYFSMPRVAILNIVNTTRVLYQLLWLFNYLNLVIFFAQNYTWNHIYSIPIDNKSVNSLFDQLAISWNVSIVSISCTKTTNGYWGKNVNMYILQFKNKVYIRFKFAVMAVSTHWQQGFVAFQDMAAQFGAQ